MFFRGEFGGFVRPGLLFSKGETGRTACSCKAEFADNEIKPMKSTVIMTRRQAVLACSTALTSLAGKNKGDAAERVHLERVPDGGLQPQVAMDDRGTLHIVYYAGDVHHGDLFYVRSADGGATVSSALQVNSQPGSAI